MQSNSPATAGPAGFPRVLTDANIVVAAPVRRCVCGGPGAPGPLRGCDLMTKGRMFRHSPRFPAARGSGGTDASDLGQKHWRTWTEKSKVLDGKEVTGV